MKLLKNKFIYTLIVLVLTATVTFSGCSEDVSDGAGRYFTYTLTANPQNLDPQLAEDEASLTLIKNTFTGLVGINTNGEIEKQIAVDYQIQNNGLTYRFSLNDDCYWYSKNSDKGTVVTAQDFVYAFQRIFNPDTHSPYRDMFKCIKNANAIINGEADYTTLGVYAESSDILVFELDKADYSFIYLLTTAPAMPCNKAFFEKTNARYGLDEDSTISNGAFVIKQWFYDPYGKENFIALKRNSKNSSFAKVYPTGIRFNIENDAEAPINNFYNELTECFITTQKYDKSLEESFYTKEYDFSSIGLIFNPNNEIFSNKKLQNALIQGIDRVAYKDELSESLSPSASLIPDTIKLNGKGFEGGAIAPIDASQKAAAQEEWKTAMSELELVTINSGVVLIPDSIDSGSMMTITRQWQELFGAFIGVEYVTYEEYNKRIAEGKYDIALVEISAEYNHPYYLLENYTEKLKSFGVDFTARTAELETLRMDNSTVEQYKSMETALLNEGGFIPLFYGKKYLVCNNHCKDIEINPFNNQIDFKNAKWFGE